MTDATVTHYIGVAHRQQVLIARDAGFVAFSHGRESAVRALSPGDRVIYYAPREEPDGAPVQAFVALAEVTGTAPEERPYRSTGRPGWVRDARFEEVTEVPVRPLLDRLSFVRDPRHWGMAFRGGRFRVTPADFGLIEAAMKGEAP